MRCFDRVAAGFALWRVCPYIDSTNDQVLKIYDKKDTHKLVNETKQKKKRLCSVLWAGLDTYF